MIPRPKPRALPLWAPALVLALLCSSEPSGAHSFYLDARLRAPADVEILVVDVRVGHAFRGEVLPRMDHHVDRFVVLDAEGAERPLSGVDGRAPAGLAAGVGDPALVLYESRGVEHTMTREGFEGYAREEGLSHLLNALDPAPGGFESETFHRCAKAVVGAAVGPASLASRLAGRATGCTLDLVLVELSAGTGEALEGRFRLLLRGKPLPLALVRATAERSGRETDLRTDEDGEVVLALEDGRWMLSAVHLELGSAASAAAQDTRWRSWWSSLVIGVGTTLPAPSPASGG